VADLSISGCLIRYWGRKIPHGDKENAMAHYMLLLRSQPNGFASLSPEEMQKVTEKYMEWRTRPFVLDGKGLADHSGRLVAKGGASVTEGPFSESHEVVAGYYAIEAADWDEAVKLALTNPHVNAGSIEIREILHRAS
jgi:hypothetical protein